MGTREVYEEKLRTGNVYHHDPTIKPGLGSPRCPRCLSLLDSTSENGEWAITPVLHDATAVAGSGIGAMLSAIHGFNTGIPLVQKVVKGPKWLPFVVGLPPLLMYSAASAAFGGVVFEFGSVFGCACMHGWLLVHGSLIGPKNALFEAWLLKVCLRHSYLGGAEAH